MSVVRPRQLNVSAMTLELVNAMRDFGEEIREQFEDTTNTWHHKPRFEPSTSVPKVGMDVISVETSTSDEVYGFVNEGTKPHAIFPVHAKVLAFPGTFSPKTFPGIIGSSAGSSGPVDRFSKKVMHPGTEARKFDEVIAERQEKIFKSSLTRTMSLVAKASGHFVS